MIKTHTIYSNEDGFEFTFHPIEDTLSIKKVKNGYEARYLIQEEDAQGPDEWGDDNLFLVNYHRDFDVRKDEVITEDDARTYYQGEKIEQEKEYYIFNLTSYIHSGVVLYLGEHSNPSGIGYGHFDTSHVGLVLVSKKEAKDREEANRLATTLINEWNKYLAGDVYCLVKEEYDKQKKLEVYDTLGNVYGLSNALEVLKTEM